MNSLRAALACFTLSVVCLGLRVWLLTATGSRVVDEDLIMLLNASSIAYFVIGLGCMIEYARTHDRKPN